MPQARELMLERKVDGIVRIRSDFSRNLALGDAKCRSSSTAPTPTRPHHPGLCPGRRPMGGAPRRGRQASRRPGGRARPPVVQRGQRQPLLSGPGPGRAGHDADRRDADRPGGGPRMGARHPRSAVRHAGPGRRDPARQDDSLFRAGHVGLVLCLLAAQVPVSTCRFAARSGAAGVSMLYLLVALGIGLADLVGDQDQFVASQVDDAGHVPAGHDAVGLYVRSAQRAGGRPVDHLRLAGALLRGPAADDFPGRRRLERDRAQRRGAGRHGGGAARADSALATRRS